MNTREIPAFVEGYGPVRPFTGVEPLPAVITRAATRIAPDARGREKLLRDIDAAFDACAIRDGMTLSLHHHLRNGDQVLNQVLAIAAQRGLTGLHRAEFTLRSACAADRTHAHRCGHGDLDRVRGRSCRRRHFARRARDADGDDDARRARVSDRVGQAAHRLAFIAAPAADAQGNLSGAEGRAACGPIGYAMAADRVVAITDDLRAQPPAPLDIRQTQVDFVVVVDSIGDPKGILSGTTRPTPAQRPWRPANAARRCWPRRWRTRLCPRLRVGQPH